MPSIAELLLAQGAQAAEARRRLGEISGQMWSNLGQTISQVPQQILHAQAAGRQAELENIQLAEAKQRQAGQQALDQAMQPVTPQGPQEPGAAPQTPQNAYLDANGLWDISKLQNVFAAQGMGHLAPDLLKSAEGINDSILKHREYEQKAADAKTILFGDMADGVLKLSKLTGVPIDRAIDMIAQPAIATGRLKPAELAQIKGQLMQLPPDQQQAALTAAMDAAAKLTPEKDLAEGAERADRYNRITLTNTKKTSGVEKATFGLTQADGTVKNVEGFFDKNANNGQGAYLVQTPDGKRVDVSDRVVKAETPESAQSIDKQVRQPDGTWKAATILFDPKSQKYRYADGREITDPANNIRPIPPPVPASERPKSQDTLEQEARGVLMREASSRSGVIGTEDQKVAQANRLLAMFHQSYDPKTGEYNIPKVQVAEMALGLARLMSPSGQVGIQLEQELSQATLKGDIDKLFTYVTGTPFNGSTQDVYKMFRDSIQRQGQVAMENRGAAVNRLQGLLPTNLEPARLEKLTRDLLVPLRQYRVIQNNQTGERKMQESIDGGNTWR